MKNQPDTTTTLFEQIVFWLDLRNVTPQELPEELNYIEQSVIPHVERKEWATLTIDNVDDIDLTAIHSYTLTIYYIPKSSTPTVPLLQNLEWAMDFAKTQEVVVKSVGQGLTSNDFVQCHSMTQVMELVMRPKGLRYQYGIIYGRLAFLNTSLNEKEPNMIVMRRGVGALGVWERESFTYTNMAGLIVRTHEVKWKTEKPKITFAVGNFYQISDYVGGMHRMLMEQHPPRQFVSEHNEWLANWQYVAPILATYDHVSVVDRIPVKEVDEWLQRIRRYCAHAVDSNYDLIITFNGAAEDVAQLQERFGDLCDEVVFVGDELSTTYLRSLA